MEKDSSYGIPGPWRQSLGSSDLLTDGKSWGPYNTGPLSQPHHTVMPFAHHFNDFLFCFTICNLLHVLVTSIYLFCCCLLPWMPLWALIPSTGSPKRFFFFFFSLSQSIIPADYSVCHSVLRFITILGFILSYTCSQASFISFSGASRMEEVAINRRKDVMLAGSVMSKFMVCKFQIRALALDPPSFFLQVTEPSRILTSKLTLWTLYTLSGLCEQRISLYLCKFTHMSSPFPCLWPSAYIWKNTGQGYR